MIDNELKSWSYYKSKFPLFLQNSYGILEHFRMLVEALTKFDMAEDEILDAFDILSPEYIDKINQMDPSAEKAMSDILDKIGVLYGVVRYFDVTYLDETTKKHASLALTNTEFLKLIKAQIIQNNYDGTYASSVDLYNKIGLPVYLLLSVDSGEVYSYLDNSMELTENEKILFLAGKFTLQIMGMSYKFMIKSAVSLLLFDASIETRFWDKGGWGL